MSRTRTTLLALAIALVCWGCSDQELYHEPEEPEPPGPPDIEVTPLSIEFGSMQMGTELSQQVTISSVGDRDLIIDSMEIVGPEHFVVDTESTPLTLGNGGISLATVTFTALDGNDCDGIFEIQSNDPDEGVVEVHLHGQGLGPAILIDPPVWDFGNQGVFCEADVDLEVRSTGNAPVTIDTWSFSSLPSTTAMSWSTTELYEGLVLDPEQSAIISIHFTAEELESYEGALTVSVVEDIPAAQATQTGAGVGGDWVTDSFIQEGNYDTDILWVIDNSCSMSEEQTTLADDFISFYDIVETAGVDYHIAAVTTDHENFLGTTKVIDSTTSNGDQVFADNCMVGTMGSGTEHGLQYGWEALQLAVNNTSPNQNFYRASAGLRVIFVSDEHDQSGSWSAYVSDYQGLKTNPNHVILSAICGTDGVDAVWCNGPGGDAMAGTGYVEAADATGGVLASICDTDWSQALTTLGWQSLSLADTLALTQEPIPSTISVVKNGAQVTVGWSYDAVINAVVFEEQYVPVDGDVIDITYQVPGTCVG